MQEVIFLKSRIFLIQLTGLCKSRVIYTRLQLNASVVLIVVVIAIEIIRLQRRTYTKREKMREKKTTECE